MIDIPLVLRRSTQDRYNRGFIPVMNVVLNHRIAT